MDFRGSLLNMPRSMTLDDEKYAHDASFEFFVSPSLMFGSYIMPRRTSESSYNNKIFNMSIPENRTIIGDNIVEKPNFKK